MKPIRDRHGDFEGKGPILSPATLWRDPARLIASGFGIGFSPMAPGTWASLAALVAGYGIVRVFGRFGLAAAFGAALVVGLWAANICVRKARDKDPSFIVIDEIAGQWLALVPVAPDPWLWALGFVLFRAADILKPWPVSWVERRFSSGLGVMLDDVAAAIYAGLGVFVAALALSGAAP